MLMLRQRNRYKIFMAGVAAAAILLSVFRIVVMINHIQINTVGIDFYLDRVPAVTAFDISAAAICIAAAVFSFFLGKTASRKLEYDTAAVIFRSALSGFMMLSSGLYLLYRFFAARELFYAYDIIPVIFTLLASAAFFLYSSKKVSAFSPVTAYFGLLPVIAVAARLIVDYVSQKDYPSTDINAYHILGLLALTLFLVNEGKFAIGKGSPFFYMLFGSVSVIFLFVYSVPYIVLAAFWLMPLNDMVMYSALDIIAALYILSRIMSLAPAERENTD